MSATHATDAGEHTLQFGVITIADDRQLETDAAGEAITSGLEAGGHEIVIREHVGSGYDRVQSIVERLIKRDDVDIVITAGSTSIEPDDVAIEAVSQLLNKELRTFTALFTQLGYERIGSSAVAVRSLAGVAKTVPVFCLPGDADAATLAIEELILPEAGLLVDLAHPDDDQSAAADDAAESSDGGS